MSNSMDGLEIQQIIADTKEDLRKEFRNCEEQGIVLAEAEKKYNILMRQKALIEKDNGMPVTFISQFIRGDEEIATLREKRDIAEVKYEVSQEKIRYLRKQLDQLNAQADREWSMSR